MLKLVIVDCDEVHLFSSLAAKQGGELFVNNGKLYHVLQQCFWVFKEQLAGFKRFHLRFVPHFQGDIRRFSIAVIGVAFRDIQTVAPQSTCRLTGLELTSISQ